MTKPSSAPIRGSRKHVLDWTGSADFAAELIEIAQPAPVRASRDPRFMPGGHDKPEEARLERYGPTVIADSTLWKTLGSWWLAHSDGANTPNWDIAMNCEIEGRTGLVLVEAKANVPELSVAGKPLSSNASSNSKENHARISKAIRQATNSLAQDFPETALSIAKHYQLSNRIAFAWKLASLGVPTVLIYLGFLGDDGIRDAGEPFASEEHWDTVFKEHLEAVAPTSLLERRIDCGEAAFWMLSRNRPVVAPSPPRVSRPNRRVSPE